MNSVSIRIRRWLSHYRLPILSGILIGTSYIPFYPWALFYGLIPYWIFCLQSENPRRVLFAGWLTQFILTLIGFHWVAYTAHEFGHLPWVAAVPVLLAFCSFANLHLPIAAWIWAKIHQRFELPLGLSVVILTLLTAAIENWMPMIFPWHHGYPWLWAQWQGFQFADIIGFEGLSLITLGLNGWLLWTWLKRRQKGFVWLSLGGVVAGLLLFNYLGSLYGEKHKKTDSQFRILNVQANIGNIIKYYAEQGSYQASKTITGKYYELTSQGVNQHRNLDFIIWPETAFPDFLDPVFQNRVFPKQLKNYIDLLNIPLITGSYSRDNQSAKTYNSIFFVDEEGNIPHSPYRKTILLAFGEYFPGAEYFPWLKEIVPAISDFGRGSGPTVYEFVGVSFGPQICYEGLYPEFSRALARHGAEVFINVTNDSWFGRWFEPYQHLYMTLARVIEYRRPLIRNTNTGYSTAMLADGTLLDRSTLHEEWTGVFEIKYLKNPPLTFFAQYGQFFSPALAALTVLSILTILILRRKEKRREEPHDRSQLT